MNVPQEPRDLNYVQQRIKNMENVDRFGTRKEIKELPSILHPDEDLIYITSGFLDGNTWLIACTNKRVIFLDKGLIYGLKQFEIPLDKINSIGHTKGIFFGKITIWQGSTKYQVR